jgi:hypothetical protein
MDRTALNERAGAVRGLGAPVWHGRCLPSKVLSAAAQYEEQDGCMNQLAVLAIDARHVLQLLYRGFYRTVEPHAYGLDSNGNAVLLCYQTAGGIALEEAEGWKLLDPREAVRVIETSVCFAGPRVGYARNACPIHTILARL